MGWEKSREITLETMKVLDEARRQLHIVFPADEKSQEKKKMKIAPTFIYRHIRLSDITLRPQFKITLR